jgi:hypothetical protein
VEYTRGTDVDGAVFTFISIGHLSVHGISLPHLPPPGSGDCDAKGFGGRDVVVGIPPAAPGGYTGTNKSEEGEMMRNQVRWSFVGVVLLATSVAAHGATPANKVVAAGDHGAVAAPGEDVTLLTATMKTSKPTDLILSVTLECSILTDLTTGAVAGATSDSATAGGRVRVWIEVDGHMVPIQSESAPPQDPAAQPDGGEGDKVTFCDRIYHRDVSDNENDNDGLDKTHDYIQTKSSHGFNWVRMNTGSGDHRIEVKADLILDAPEGTAEATAVVGNRTLIVEPTKMANDAVIGTVGTN